MFKVVEVDKISKNKTGITAGFKAGMYLQEQGWMRYPPVCWELPAVLVFDEDACVAGINYERLDDELRVAVRFLWCDQDHPAALAKALGHFRRLVRTLDVEVITFTCHEGNEEMQRAVDLLKLSPVSYDYEMPVDKPK